MKRRSGPGAAHLDSVDSAEQFISAHNVSVVGFFDVRFSLPLVFQLYGDVGASFVLLLFLLFQSLESEEAKLLKEVAFDLTDTEFAMTAAPEVFQKYEVKSSSVVLFKKVRESDENQ